MFVEHKEAGEVQPTRERSEVTPMKLSEAIRIGAKMRPQCKGYLFRAGGSCALGAAYEAIGGTPIEGQIGEPGYYDQYEALYERFGRDICEEAHTRNDDGASREAVADWLESQGY